uniref:hypothetical protein n=1 Tax=Thaumasiovibrio occultus TaxID=1891184 RepID=UPI000B34FDF6|nr:hypothetical protein [Thaumasiovibrio occultus]
MKSILAVITLAFTFTLVAPTFASNGGAGASSAMGPWKGCELPNGKMDYMPTLECERQYGEVQPY